MSVSVLDVRAYLQAALSRQAGGMGAGGMGAGGSKWVKRSSDFLEAYSGALLASGAGDMDLDDFEDGMQLSRLWSLWVELGMGEEAGRLAGYLRGLPGYHGAAGEFDDSEDSREAHGVVWARLSRLIRGLRLHLEEREIAGVERGEWGSWPLSGEDSVSVVAALIEAKGIGEAMAPEGGAGGGAAGIGKANRV